MARVVIVIEDKEDEKVSVSVEPSWELMRKIARADEMTAAQAYAVLAINKIREASDKSGPQKAKKKSKLYLPGEN